MRKKPRQSSALSNKLFFLFLVLLFSITAFSQTVTGVVTDPDRKPITGATVQVKGASRTVLTDVTGRFSITASARDVLLISSVGFATQEVRVNGQSSVSVVLAIENRNLENVVVVALGIKRQEKKLGYST